MRTRFIHAHRADAPTHSARQAIGVSRSGSDARRGRLASARRAANTRLLAQMQQLHRQTKERYGAVKLWRALRVLGMVCSRRRVPLFRVVGEQHQFAPPAPNRLRQHFAGSAPHQI